MFVRRTRAVRHFIAVALPLLALEARARSAELEQALLVTSKGTLLAFCEGRKKSSSDAGDIDLLLKRSFDGGKTWTKMQVVWDESANTCGNPCPVLDARTGTIWLLLTHNLGSDTEAMIVNGTSRGSRTVWVTKSTDDGSTWSQPVEITRDVKKRAGRRHPDERRPAATDHVFPSSRLRRTVIRSRFVLAGLEKSRPPLSPG